MAEEHNQPIIIKKIKKKGEEAHGGSWKVAYADFVTAMMAFFLMMWLLNMTSQQKKAELSQYFQNYSVFEKGGGSAIGEKEGVPGKGRLDVGQGRVAAQPEGIGATQVADKLKQQVENKLKEYQDRIIIMDENGNVRIEIVDTEGDSFFPPGGTELNPAGKVILKELAEVLITLNKRLIIEGHTDSAVYTGRQFTNWELSTQRALSARIELEHDGIKPEQIEMVVGYAHTKPFVKENPADPKNRRISIVVDYKEKSAQPPDGKSAPIGQEGKPVGPQAQAPPGPSAPGVNQ